MVLKIKRDNLERMGKVHKSEDCFSVAFNF